LMKEHYQRVFLPVNFLEDFFVKILESRKLGIEINFSDTFLKSQRGLTGKARLPKMPKIEIVKKPDGHDYYKLKS